MFKVGETIIYIHKDYFYVAKILRDNGFYWEIEDIYNSDRSYPKVVLLAKHSADKYCKIINNNSVISLLYGG